jgi:O-antigen/teichoic acid export membrane protein/aminoglycoside phosphotransferase (APT) family kinase protein
MSRGVVTPRSRMATARELFATPLIRNAYSLVASTLATSVLGVVFWIVAARRFTPNEVGIDSALVSTMTFLANVAALNLANGFNRFVPTAGDRTARLVLVGYGLTVLAAAVAGVVFVAGAGLWAPSLEFLQDHPLQGGWFVAAVILWTLFALQDAVLTGLGESHFVLVENVVYGLLKLVALFVVAGSMGRFGLFTAWTVPLLGLVVAVNWLIFRRLVPARRRPPLEDVDGRSIVRLVGVDYLAALMTTATVGVIPLLVLALEGARANAFVALAWTIAYPLQLLSTNVGMAMTTEASRSPERLAEYSRRGVAHALRIVAPLAAIGVLGAPVILRVFGTEYAEHSVRSLQFFALSAIPFVFVSTYLSVARVQRRMWRVVGTTAAQSATALVLAVVLLEVLGTPGAALAWLVATSAVACGLVLGPLRPMLLGYVRPARFRPVLDRLRTGATRTREREGRRLAVEVLRSSGLARHGWRPEPAITVDDRVATARLTNPMTGDRSTLRVALDAAGRAVVEQEAAALAVVHRSTPPGARPLVPRMVAVRTTAGPAWILETRPRGEDARRALAQPARLEALLDDALSWLDTLYRATARPAVDGDVPWLAALAGTDAPARSVRHDAGASLELRLRHVRDRLREELRGRELTVSLTHGNLWLGSLLWRPETASLAGVVDWRHAAVGPPVVDVAHLLCTARALAQRRELGAVVRDLLQGEPWSESDRRRLDAVVGAGEVPARAAVLLAWLRHVSARTRGGNRFRTYDVWAAHNVQLVVETL